MKDLVIPLKIDADNAMAALHKLGDAGGEAGKKIADGADSATTQLQNATGEMLKFIGITSAAEEAKQMAHAIGQEFKDTADYISRTSEDFIKFQQNMREAAVLSGKLPATQYAKEQLSLAKGGKILTADEWRSGQESWQHWGSQYVSDADKPGTNLIEQSTVDAMLPEILGMAKARHIDQETAGRALGMIVAKMPKGTSADKYKEMFVKSLGPAELSSGSAQLSFQQLNKSVMPYVGEGTVFGEGEKGLLRASEFINMAMQSRPEEAATYGRDLLKMMKDMRQKGEFKELGVTKEMEEDPNEIIEQIGKEWRKSGQKWEDFIQPHMHGRTAMQGGELMQSMILAGEKGLRKKLQGKQVGTGGDVEKMLDAYVASGPGASVMESQAAKDIAEKEEGADTADAIAEKAKTEAQMTKDKEFGHLSLERTLSAMGRQFRLFDTSKDTRDRQIQMRTISRLGEEMKQAGFSEEDVSFEIGGFQGSSRTAEQQIQRMHDELVEARKIAQQKLSVQERQLEVSHLIYRRPLSAPPNDHGTRVEH